jgi:G3E family GTPase
VQHEVSLNRRLLTHSYNVSEIENIEGEIHEKQAKCRKLKNDSKRVKKWMKQSEKDKDNINENGFYDAEVSKLKCRLREDKQQIRQMYYDTLQKRKDLIEKHEGVIKLENSMRKMKELIDHSKNIRSSQSRINTSMAKPESVVTGKAWDLDEMRKKVEAAKRNMK